MFNPLCGVDRPIIALMHKIVKAILLMPRVKNSRFLRLFM